MESTQVEKLKGQADVAIQTLLDLIASPNWTKTGDNTYAMKNGDRSVIKGQCTIKTTIKQLEDYIDNEKNFLPDNIIENKVLVEGEFGQVKYRRGKAVWPVDDREFVIIKAKRREENRLIIAMKSIDYQVPATKGVVRAQMYSSGFVIQKISQTEVKISNAADLDPKGSIPDMIKNKMLERQSKITLKFKEELQK